MVLETPKSTKSGAKKARVKFEDRVKHLKKLGIPLPSKNIKTYKNAINAKYRKFGDVARSAYNHPENWKKIHVTKATLAELQSEHWDRFKVIGKTAKRTTVMVRMPPGETLHIRKRKIYFENKRLGIERKVIPVKGRELLSVMEQQVKDLKANEHLLIQVGDKTPIHLVIRDMSVFNNYFAHDAPDPFGNWIFPAGSEILHRKRGWKYPETRPSDYLSVVRVKKDGQKKEGKKSTRGKR